MCRVSVHVQRVCWSKCTNESTSTKCGLIPVTSGPRKPLTRGGQRCIIIRKCVSISLVSIFSTFFLFFCFLVSSPVSKFPCFRAEAYTCWSARCARSGLVVSEQKFSIRRRLRRRRQLKSTHPHTHFCCTKTLYRLDFDDTHFGGIFY